MAALRKQYAQNQKRIDVIDSVFCKVYEDSAARRLSEMCFEQLSNKYKREQTDLDEQNSRLQQSFDAYIICNIIIEYFMIIFTMVRRDANGIPA